MPRRLPVPHRSQLAEGYCLPACVEMVLAYWGVERKQSALAARMGMREGTDIQVSLAEFQLAWDAMSNLYALLKAIG